MKYIKIRIFLLSLILLCSCTASKDQKINFLSGRIEILKPGSWETLNNLNDEADVKIGNMLKEAYLIVLSENKADLEDGMTMKEYSYLNRSAMKERVNNYKEVSGPINVEINDMNSVQYEITGVVDYIKVKYLHTTIEGKEHIHHILAWSLPSKYQSNLKDFKRVLLSFKEIL